jgi:signal peptidase I
MTLCVLAVVGCSRRTHDAPSSSMEPTILAGSKVTIDYDAYQSVQPARFDIVAFHPQSQPTAIFTFRVIGLPGEAVTLTDAAVLIDGKKVSPPDALRYAPVASGINQTNLTAVQFFLLGDNTARARDSRYLGPINRNQIFGKVVRIEQPDGAVTQESARNAAP